MAENKTVASLAVEIGCETSDFQKGMDDVQKDLEKSAGEMKEMAKSFGESASQMKQDWKHMSDEMKAAYTEAQKALEPLKKQQQEVEYGYFKLAQSMDDYKGSTGDFMKEVTKLGAEQKKVTDEMMKQDKMLRASLLENVGTILNMSGQSEKIAANYNRMRNPIYMVNNGLLAMTNRLEAQARAGQASVLALKMLGPTANMKELNDMITLINRGLMRQQMVMMAAAIASYFLYGALHQAAMGNEEYKKSFETMLAKLREAFQPMVDVFTTVMTAVYNFITAVAELMIKFNEAHPLLAKIIQGFLMLLPALFLLLSPLAIGIGLFNGMAASFAALWPLIAPLVTGLAAMAGTVAIVAGVLIAAGLAIWYLWNNSETFKNAVITGWNLIKETATTVWNAILLVLQTVWAWISENGAKAIEQVKQWWAQNGDEILTKAQTIWNAVSTAVSTAVEAIKTVVEKIIGGVKEFWNENHTEIETHATNIWNAIKNLVETVMNAVEKSIRAVLDAVVPFIKEQLDKIKKWWKENGDEIMEVVKNTWNTLKDNIMTAINIIAPIITGFLNTAKENFEKVWPVAERIVTNAWNIISTAIETGIDIALEAIMLLVNLLNGDWEDAFNNALNIAEDIMEGIMDLFNNMDLSGAGADIIRGLINGMGGMVGAAIDKAREIASSIADTISGALQINSPSKVTTYFGKMAGEGLVVGMDDTIPDVKKMASRLVDLPEPNIDSRMSIAFEKEKEAPQSAPTNIYVTIPAKDVQEFVNVTDFFKRLPQVARQY